MLLLRSLFLLCMLWTANATEQNMNINRSDLSVNREKRALDIGLLLRKILMNSAQASSIKTNAVVYKTRPRPTPLTTSTTSTTTTTPSTPPNNTADDIRDRPKSQIGPWQGFDMDYDAPTLATSTGPTPPKSAEDVPMAATVPLLSQPNLWQQLQLQTIPNATFYATPGIVVRPGKRFYNGPSYINFDNLQGPNRYSVSNYQEFPQRKTQTQQTTRQQEQEPINRLPIQMGRPAPKMPASQPLLPAPSPSRRPSQLNNKLLYQFAQPDDTSSEERAVDIANDDSSNTNTSSKVDANSGGGEAALTESTTVSSASEIPMLQEPDDTPKSSLTDTLHGFNQFSNQFTGFDTTYDGFYPQPISFGQYFLQ